MNKKMRKFIEKKKEDRSYWTEIKVEHIVSPVTVLLGPNGTGKSCSIREMKHELKKRNIKYVSFSKDKDDAVLQGSPAFGPWDPVKIVSAFHSEGERLDDSLFFWFRDVFMKTILKDKDDLYVFIDEFDSGRSYDNMIEALQDIMTVINSELNKGRNIKLVLTCNSYEMADLLRPYNNVDFLWVPTRQSITINSYNGFIKRYKEYYSELRFK